MKNVAAFVIATCVVLGLSFPCSAASKIAELKEACKANPQHAICQEREAKMARAKAKRETKMQNAIDAVKENR